MTGKLFGGTEILEGSEEQEPKSVEDFENTRYRELVAQMVNERIQALWWWQGLVRVH